jgi:hypothetical protein
MKDGLNTIRDERKRQIEELGFTHEKDDLYVKGELLEASTCYMLAALMLNKGKTTPEQLKSTTIKDGLWPFPPEWLKITDVNSCLRKAGGLLVAEMDRRQREEAAGLDF